jgi:hypothetical protein
MKTMATELSGLFCVALFVLVSVSYDLFAPATEDTADW